MEKHKIFMGVRLPNGVGDQCHVFVIEYDANAWSDDVEMVMSNVDIRPLHLIGNHSPSGFEWGYGGSGPHELAQCILHECEIDVFHSVIAQYFKETFVSKFPSEGWVLPARYIFDWLRDHEYVVSTDR